MTQSSTGYTPSEIQTMYNLNMIVPPNNKPLGYGIKVAVITIYHYSNLQNDLNTFCKKNNLVPITLNIINQAGNVKNNNFALQANMAVQVINTISSGVILYVIEAATPAQNDIKNAISTAVNLGVNIISLGFGTNEYATQSSLEHLFMNTNITFISSVGDTNTVNYPSVSNNVVSVGGSTLTLNPNNTRNTETVWESSGFGTSNYTSRPSYQSSVNENSKRAVPDLCMMADSGIIIYSSIIGGYVTVSGTSLASNIFAGVIAIANQMRKSSNKQMLNSISTSPLCLQNYLYKTIYTNSTLYSSCFYKMNNNGYNINCGLGGINANELCSQLAKM